MKPTPIEVARQAALDTFLLIETGDPALAERLIAADFLNHEAEDDPEDAGRQERGPAGFLATGTWLRASFSELRFEELDSVAEGTRVVVMATMTGTHTGDFQHIPPTQRRFRQRQIHLFEIADGRVRAHRAQRDDLGLLMQLGWRPGGGGR